MEDSKHLVIWLRALIPLVCAAILVASPDQPVVTDVLVVATIDTSYQLWRNLRSNPAVVDYRFAMSRDAAYAMLFYVANFHSNEVPALAIMPVVITEALVIFGWRSFLIGVGAEISLVAVHMSTVRVTTHHFTHPGWMMEVVVATVASTIFGATLSHLQKTRADIATQRVMMKESLTQMLQAALSDGGGTAEITESDIRQMIDEICRSANPEKGRQLGARLAQLVSSRQGSQRLLTAREQELLGYLATGLSYSKIAATLYLSEGTVRAHAASIMRKADVHTRGEAVAWARAQHLISSSD